jgi:hypothetical protein
MQEIGRRNLSSKEKGEGERRGGERREKRGENLVNDPSQPFLPDPILVHW